MYSLYQYEFKPLFIYAYPIPSTISTQFIQPFINIPNILVPVIPVDDLAWRYDTGILIVEYDSRRVHGIYMARLTVPYCIYTPVARYSVLTSLSATQVSQYLWCGCTGLVGIMYISISI